MFGKQKASRQLDSWCILCLSHRAMQP